MRQATVLISSAGRRVGLIDCFRADARELGVALRVVAVDVRPELSAACALADAAHKVPPVSSPDFIDRLEEIAIREGARIIVPTIDTELATLSGAAPRLLSHGIRAVVSDQDAVMVAGSKLQTARRLAAAGLPVPRTALLSDAGDADAWRFPVVIKPDNGSSSKGLQIARDAGELGRIAVTPELIIQEWAPGREITINVFFDRNGFFVTAVPHERLEVRAGEVSKALTCRIPALQEMASKLPSAVPGIRGPICFQAKLEGRDAVIFEINARFGGGFPVAHAAGAPFSRWLLEEALELPRSAGDAWEPDVLMLRYDQAVFLRNAPAGIA